MSGHFWLDWAGLAVSLFNTLLMVWLGLTVLFNAERRTLGVFLAAGGLLAGAAFFVSHSVILSLGASTLVIGFQFWWHVGWLPIIAAPYAWYLLMLWYTGYWDDPHSPLHRRHAPWLWLSVVFTLALAVLLLVANPLPILAYDAYVQVERLPSAGSLPIILLVYPPYIFYCLGLALDALLRPAPSGRVLGDQARRRARPWLVIASLVLIAVSLMVGAMFIWLIQQARVRPGIADLVNWLSTRLTIIDLVLASLLMLAVLLLSRAVVSYEIFTGKTLPRRGFFTRWRTTVVLIALLSALAALGIVASLPSIVTVLAVLLVCASSFALFNYQTFIEREESIRQLRPLTTSPRLFESILATRSAPKAGQQAGSVQAASPISEQQGPELNTLFTALCRDVLGARKAALLPTGSLAALGISAIAYPPGDSFDMDGPENLPGRFSSPQTVCLPLQDRQGNLVFAVPLWSERGPVGLLLLGEKSDGGLYSLEEIEIARASGERLADLLASAELARRLASLQRQRLSETGVIDQRTRRVLHDEVLPRLHTALLQLSQMPEAGQAEGQEVLENLTGVHRQVSNLLRDLPIPRPPRLAALGPIGALKQVIEDELPSSFDEVTWSISPGADEAARSLPETTREVLFYAAREALRNAARHARPAVSRSPLPSGRETCPLRLKVTVGQLAGQTDTGELEIQIEDNGVGLDLSAKAPASEGGQGLALHSTLMALVNGSLAIESAPDEFTRVILTVPLAPSLP